MTLDELAARVTLLEAEVRELRRKAAVAEFKPDALQALYDLHTDDPAGRAAAAEANRLGREWREQVNRESLEEAEREAAQHEPPAAGRGAVGGRRSDAAA